MALIIINIIFVSHKPSTKSKVLIFRINHICWMIIMGMINISPMSCHIWTRTCFQYHFEYFFYNNERLILVRCFNPYPTELSLLNSDLLPIPLWTYGWELVDFTFECLTCTLMMKSMKSHFKYWHFWLWEMLDELGVKSNHVTEYRSLVRASLQFITWELFSESCLHVN